MNNNIEDIYIGANYNSDNKKSKNIVLFIILFLLLILIAMVFVYMYFFNTKTISTKQLFFNHLSSNNVQELVSESTYEDLYDKILNNNYEANSTINYSTNLEHEKLEGIDISKFTFNLNSNSYNDKTYRELGINYSGNEELKIKLITNQDSIGIAEDEVVNKYVGIHYNNLKDLYGIELDEQKIKSIFSTEKNDLTEDDKKQLVSSNITKVMEMIPEEKFTIQDNMAISQGDNNIPVTAYTLTLSQTELSNILVEVFKNVRNNEEILNKLIYKSSEKPTINIMPGNVTITPIIEEPVEEGQEEGIQEQPEQEGEQEFEAEETPDFEPISGEVTEFNDPQVIEGETEEEYNQELENEFYDENPEIIQPEENNYTPELELTQTPNLDVVGEESNINLEVFNGLDEYANIIKLLFGLKINKTQIELEEILDSIIEKIDGMTGNGLTITLYVSKEKTEKVSIVMPNENTIEIEILKKSDSENRMKLTYLYKGDNSIFASQNETSNEEFFDNDEIISVEEELLEEQTNGISLDISKIKTATNISIDTTISYIENEKITKKINVKSDINDVSTSKSVNNSLIITFSTKENESKIVADTTFKFSNLGESIPDLTDENCLFLETLSTEDYNITMKAIKGKIDYVWNQKKEHFGFIDTNTKSSKKSIIDRASNSVTRDEARQVLENKISSMINEATENGQEFTVQNLENLQIDGYEVSSVVNENGAVIVIDIYTFNVNNEFNIIDA